MDEPKRLVVEHFPAERLPEELRGSFADDVTVTVTVAEESAPEMPRPLQDFVGAGKGLYRSPEHVLQQLREGRDAV